jgi:hypothetical protein
MLSLELVCWRAPSVLLAPRSHGIAIAVIGLFVQYLVYVISLYMIALF